MTPRRWTRRGVGVLAGSGLIAIGLAGPLAGGAPAQSAASGSGASGSQTLVVTAPTTSSPSPPPATTSPPPTTAPTPPTTTPTSTSTSTTGPSRPPAPAPGPKIVSQHSQPARPAPKKPPAAPKPVPPKDLPKPPAVVPKPAAPIASGPNGVALPPQLVASQFGVLPMGTASPTLAAEALRFYRIPLFLLPVYQAAAIQYGVPWQVLAAINEVETDYGQDLSVSTAGALGWMQFMPQTWLEYGVDASRAGFADPFNPADAVFAAARYLRAAGATTDLRGAIYAYNHSWAYVSSVLLRARLIASDPEPVIAALTGLAEGRMPVAGGQLPPAQVGREPGAPAHGPRLISIRGPRGAAALAAQDGRVVDLGRSKALGNYLVLRDVYGDSYTYAGLGSLAGRYAVASLPSAPRPPAGSAASRARDARPGRPASAGVQPTTLAPTAGPAPAAPAAPAPPAPATPPVVKVRLFAHAPAPTSSAPAPAPSMPAKPAHWAPLRRGATVTAGTRLGTLRDAGPAAGVLHFAIQPPGDPRTVDPGPVLANWRLLDTTANPTGPGSGDGLLQNTAGEVFLLSKSELERQVLSDPTISIYACGRKDITSGAIDARVLALLAYLSRSGLKPTVSGLKCDRGAAPLPGDRAELAAGEGVDISAINGIPIAGHQGLGSVTDTTIRALLTLQGRFVPDRIASLMRYPGATNTYARHDHGDRIDVGWQLAGTPTVPPPPGMSVAAAARAARAARAAVPAATPPLDAKAWDQLIGRLAAIPDPAVPKHPSGAALRDPGAKTPAPAPPGALRLPFKSR